MDISTLNDLSRIRPGMRFSIGGMIGHTEYTIAQIFLPNNSSNQGSMPGSMQGYSNNNNQLYDRSGHRDMYNQRGYTAFENEDQYQKQFNSVYGDENSNGMNEVIAEVFETRNPSNKADATFIKGFHGSQQYQSGLFSSSPNNYRNENGNYNQIQVELIPTSGYHFVPVIPSTDYRNGDFNPQQGWMGGGKRKTKGKSKKLRRSRRNRK